MQQQIDCEVGADAMITAGRLPGLEDSRYVRIGVKALSSAPEWRALRGDASLGPKGTRTLARCLGGKAGGSFRAFLSNAGEKGETFVIAPEAARASPLLDSAVTEASQATADVMLKDSLYSVWTRVWTLASGARVTIKEYTEIRAGDDEDVYRGSTWDVGGPTRVFSCEGTFGFKVP